MAKIASLAGVSRQTLYNEFGDRDGLIEAYVLTEAGRFLEAVEDAVDEGPAADPVAAIRAAMVTILSIGDDHPVLLAVATGTASPKVLDVLSGGAGAPLHQLASARLASILQGRWPHAPTTATHDLCEVVTRLMISHLTQSDHDPAGVTDRVLSVLRPSIEQIFA